MINPRKTFQELESANKWKWQDLMDSQRFQAGASAALSEMQANTPMATTPENAAALYWRMVGARDFLKTMMNLIETPTVPRAPLAKNLDHTV